MSELRIAAIRLLCVDVARTRAFYVAAFGCRADDADALSLGDQRIEFAAATSPAASVAPANSTAFQHFAIVVADMAAAMALLDRIPGWRPISRDGPQVLPAASGGATAFKFHDPDGHPLELLAFQGALWPGNPDARPGAGFLGIDHSAITVADTDRSAAFYAGLGFSALKRQINRGAEQDRLDDLAGAVVEVTGLRPPGGAPPHLELLCYRHPGPRVETAPPGDPRATRLVLRGGPAADGERALRDPDGHALVHL